jgi:integrase
VAAWGKLRQKLEKDGSIGPGLTPYGLRHTLAVILRQRDYDERAIADALGQKTVAAAPSIMKNVPVPTSLRCHVGSV